MIRRPRAAIAALLSVLLGGALAIGLLAAPAGALAFPTTRLSFPITLGPGFSGCPNDTVVVSGNLVVQSSGQINNNQFTLVTHFFPDHVVGTDSAGNIYRAAAGPDQDISHASARTANILTFHDVFTLNLIGQGRAPNFRLHANTVTVIDFIAQTETVTVLNSYLDCG